MIRCPKAFGERIAARDRSRRTAEVHVRVAGLEAADALHARPSRALIASSARSRKRASALGLDETGLIGKARKPVASAFPAISTSAASLARKRAQVGAEKSGGWGSSPCRALASMSASLRQRGALCAAAVSYAAGIAATIDTAAAGTAVSRVSISATSHPSAVSNPRDGQDRLDRLGGAVGTDLGSQQPLEPFVSSGDAGAAAQRGPHPGAGQGG